VPKREPFNVNSLAQVAAMAALKDTAFLTRSKKLLREGRRYLTKELKLLGVKAIPSATNFILIELGPRAIEVAEKLFSEGVIVRDMQSWNMPNCIRVSIGTMPQNYRFIRTLKAVLKTII